MKKSNLSRLGLFTTAAIVSCISIESAAVASVYNAADKLSGQPNIAIQVVASDEVIQGAQNFIENVSARGLSFLQNESLGEEQRKKRVPLAPDRQL